MAPAQPAAPSPPVVESPPTPARDTAPEVQFTFTEPGTPAPNVTSISSASLRAVEVPQAADDSGANAKAAVDSVDVGVPARRGEAAPPLRAPVDAPARSGKRGWIVAGAGAALALGALGLLQARGSARFVSEASPVAAVNAVNAVNAVDALTAPASLTTGELHERALEAPAAPAAESPRTAPATLENVAPAPASAAASDVAAAPASAAVSDVAAAPASAAASAVGAAPGSAAVAYNEKALEGALRWGITNAEACHRAGRPSGSAQATLTFGPAGKVLRAELEGEPIASAPVSKCILSFLRSMMIPAFSGPEFTITRQITLR